MNARLLEWQLVDELDAAPDTDRLLVVGADAQAFGEDGAHFALGFRDETAIRHAVEDLCDDRFVHSRDGPVGVDRADRNPGLIVDLHAVAVELGAHLFEEAHHSKGFAAEADPAAELSAGAEQALARAFAQQDHPTPLFDVRIGDSAASADTDASNHHRLGVDSPDVDIDEALPERGREHFPRLRTDDVDVLGTRAKGLDIVEVEPEKTPIDAGSEILADPAGPHRPHVNWCNAHV